MHCPGASFFKLSGLFLTLALPLVASLSEVATCAPSTDKTENVCEHFAANLFSLVFVSNPDDMAPGNDTGGGVILKDVDIPKKKDFKKRMDPFLGRPINLHLMTEIRKEVVLYYREHRIPMVEAIIPSEQDITDGRLYVVILRGKLGKVRVDGGSDALKEKLQKCIRSQKGEMIDARKMQDDLEWLNKDPFRSVDLIYERGEKLSSTDAILKVKEKIPFSVYSGYENSGYQIAGDSRWTTGFNWGHLWWQDHELNAQFRFASPLDQLWSIAANYIAPLPWRDTIVVFGNYIRIHPNMSQDFNNTLPPTTESRGKSWQTSCRYNFALPRIGDLTHTFVFGYDFKRTNNFLIYALIPFYRQDVDISQFLLRYEGQVTDCLGFTAFGASLFLSPGSMTAFNRNFYFEIERPGARAFYIYGTLNGDRKFYLPKDFSYVMSALIQLTGYKLMPSEQILLGGQFTVRGYKENAIIGDRGFLLKNEVHTCPWHFFKNKKFKDDLHFLAFIDLGYTASADKSVNKTSSAFLMSLGPGLRYMIKDYVNVRIDYGVQLKSLSELRVGKPGHGRFHSGIFISF